MLQHIRFTTAGESHGKGTLAILEGLPAGLPITPMDVARDLARRQLGYGRGGRMAIEKDAGEVLSGIRLGETLGSPVAIWIRNRDHSNWEVAMAVDARTGAEMEALHAVAVAALLAIHDNCNSLHTNSYDEAITTPSEESVRRAMAIQMIIAREFGRDDFSYLINTHEHADHIRGVGALARRYRLPVWASAGTFASGRCGKLPEARVFTGHGQSIDLGGLRVRPYPVPHDAREPCQAVFAADGLELGLLTDAGSITQHIVECLNGCDGLLLTGYRFRLFSLNYGSCSQFRLDICRIVFC